MVNKQIKIVVKRGLGPLLEADGFLRLIEELLSELNQGKFLYQVGHHFLGREIEFRVDPFRILLLICSTERCPEGSGFFVTGLDDIKRKLYVLKPEYGTLLDIFKDGNIAFG